MNIQEIRSKYPQYSDLSDEQLGKALHQKFYSDMPYAEFAQKAGITAPKQEPAAPTTGERAGAAVGGVNRGIAGLVGLPVDTVENIINLGLAAYGTAATAAGRPDLAPNLLRGSFGGSESIASGMEKLGINTQNPRPDDPASRMLYMGGLVGGAGGRRPVAPAAGAAILSETLGPEWAGVGAMTPQAARQAAGAARVAAAGDAAKNLETFRAAGAEPTVGMATNNAFILGVENLAAKFPGGAGVMKKFAEKLQKDLGSDTRTGVSAEAGGRAIEEGAKNFITRTKQKWNELDDAVVAKIPKDRASVTPTNTLKALDELTTPVRGAERSTGTPLDPRIAEIKRNLLADLESTTFLEFPKGTIPYEALRTIRSRVGASMDDALVAGAKSGEMKKLYGALSKDLELAAKNAGAGKEFDRQNTFYKARMARVETLERVIGNTPEQTFKRFMPSDPDAVTTTRQILRSLDPSERKVVTEAVVNRLGRALPGKQNEFGEVFSTETFLSNWNRMSPGAKAQLFPDYKMRNDLDEIARASRIIREGSKVFQNISGTAGSLAAGSVYSSPIFALAFGDVTPLVAAGSAAGAAYVGTKMLTNPRVVEWLARAPRVKPENVPSHLARLGVIYNETDDQQLRAELARYVQAIGK